MPVIDTIQNIIRQRFEQEIEAIISDLRDELNQQGHKATGSLEKSFEAEIKDSDSDGFLGIIFGNDYWEAVDTGVAANKIPYTPGAKTGKKTSKYIQALIEWAGVVRPELSDKERKGFVFAVAHKHSVDGMPTKGSYSFSKNGERKNFVQRTIDKHIDTLAEKLSTKEFTETVASEILRQSNFT